MLATAAEVGEPLLQSLPLVQSPETPLCQVLLLTLRIPLHLWPSASLGSKPGDKPHMREKE
jgi:hypothetical protein